ncbi:MAG: bifunctional DedA family/phosphatase PAP2 family protein [Actinomycetota bacterium]
MKPVFVAIAIAVLVGVVWRWPRLTKERRILALAIVGAAGVYGSGVVEIPDLKSTIEDVGRRLGQWTYLIVGLFAFLETGAFVGFIVPGETVILVGGVVAGQGEVSVVALIAIVWICAVVGDSFSFWLGRRLGRDFLIRHGSRFMISEARVEQVEQFFARHGGPTILIGRFIGLVRAIAPFVAGASGMRYRRFLPYDIIGAGLWGTAFVLLGYVFWASFDKVATYAGQGAFALGALIAFTVAVTVVYRHFKKPENRQAVSAWVGERGRVLRFAWARLTPGDLGLELTTLLAVMLVGGFVFAAMAALFGGDSLLGADRQSLNDADTLRSAVGLDIAKLLSLIGSTPSILAVTVVALVFLWRRSRIAEALAIASGTVLVYVAVAVVKAIAERPRPADPLTEALGSSFPSGHAAHSIVFVAIAVGVAHAFPRLVHRAAIVLAAIGLAAMIGLSRIYLRVHYLSDVVGGWALGAAAFAICAMVALVVMFMRQNEHSR